MSLIDVFGDYNPPGAYLTDGQYSVSIIVGVGHKSAHKTAHWLLLRDWVSTFEQVLRPREIHAQPQYKTSVATQMDRAEIPYIEFRKTPSLCICRLLYNIIHTLCPSLLESNDHITGRSHQTALCR